mmetsp:Transcript_37942/g.83342  ORF Transcript_37942/g.83342 Transcript_37942/m.83342 type:complete len:451 (+) Transcript_37942:129-1481(+)
MGLLTLDVGFDKDGTDLGNIRETLDLVVCDGTHEGGLTGIVTTKETVTLTTLKLHLCVVQQNLGTVCESELTVAKLLGIIVLILLLGNDKHLLGLDTDGLGGLVGIGLGNEAGKAGGNVLGPLKVLHEVQVHHGSRHGGKVLNDSLELRGYITTNGGLELGRDLAGITADADGLVGKALETRELSNSALGDLASLGVGNGLGVSLKSGKEEGKEGGGIEGIVNKLGHVVDDDGRLTLGGGGLLSEATKEKGNDHGKGGTLDALDEGNSGHFVHDFGNLLGLGNGGNDLGVHVLNVLVADNLAGGSHGVGGSGLDLLLGIPHAGGNLGNDFGEGNAELLGSSLGETGNALEGEDTLLPLLLNGKGGEKGGKEGLDREWVDLLANCGGSLLGSFSDLGILGAGLGKTSTQAFLGERVSLGNIGKSLGGGHTGEGFGIVLGGAFGNEAGNVGG